MTPDLSAGRHHSTQPQLTQRIKTDRRGSLQPLPPFPFALSLPPPLPLTAWIIKTALEKNCSDSHQEGIAPGILKKRHRNLTSNGKLSNS